MVNAEMGRSRLAAESRSSTRWHTGIQGVHSDSGSPDLLNYGFDKVRFVSPVFVKANLHRRIHYARVSVMPALTKI